MTVDFKLALRRLRRRPLFYSGLVVMMGSSLTVAAIAWSAAKAFVFGLGPWQAPDRIVHLQLRPETFAAGSDTARRVAERVRETPLLEARSVVRSGNVLDVDSEAVLRWGLRVAATSPAFFDMCQVPPFFGRVLRSTDNQLRPRPILLGYGVFLRLFGGDPTLVGRVIDIPGTALGRRWLVTGIMPKDFNFPPGANAWILAEPDEDLPSLIPNYARLTGTVSIDALRSALPGVAVEPLDDFLLPNRRQLLVASSALLLTLLLLCWVQMAASLISESGRRAKEFTIRMALGGTRRSLAVSLVPESVLVAAGTFVVFLVLWGPLMAILGRFLPMDVGGLDRVVPSWGIGLAAWSISSVVFAVVYISVPTMSGQVGIMAAFGGPLSVPGIKRRLSTQSVILATQIALSTILWYASGLALDSYRRATQTELGFDPRGLFAVAMPSPNLDGVRGRAALDVLERYDESKKQLLQALRQLPGVSGALFSTGWPLGPTPPSLSMSVETGESIEAIRWSISVGYLALIRAHLLSGSEPAAEEVFQENIEGAGRYALVNAEFARRLSQPAIGRFVFASQSPQLRYKIVGVVADINESDLSHVDPAVYLYKPRTFALGPILLRLDHPERDAQGIEARVPTLTDALNPPRTLFRVQDDVNRLTARYRAGLYLVTMVCGLSLPVMVFGAAAGAFVSVGSRTREFAIRATLGERRGSLVARATQRLLLEIAVGLVMGLVGGAILGGLANSYLFEMHGLSGVAVAMAALLCLIAGGVATCSSVMRISQIDPITELRSV